MKICNRCGIQISDDAANCPACGAVQNVSARSANSSANGVPNYYTQGSYTPRPLNVKGLVGFILGIASLVLAWIPVIGLGCGVAGIILSVLGKKAGQPTGNTAYAVIGLILSIIGTVIGFIYTVIMIIGLVIFFMEEILW